MMKKCIERQALHIMFTGLGSLLLALSLFVPAFIPARAEGGQAVKVSGMSGEEAFLLGERMYREGVLPSGRPMQAIVKGDIPVSGTAFTCVSCHLRSGLGSLEGRVLTPPTNGNNLFRPVNAIYKGVEVISMPPRRPAYTDESLAEALRSGIDASGRKMDDIMPRYMLGDEDMALLISYLKTLSSQFSPGFSGTTLSFATVIAEDVTPEDREAMLSPLEDFVNYWNKMSKIYETDLQEVRMARLMSRARTVATARISLSRWILKGPPGTWRSQLEEYNRKNPVFALIGGITYGEWKPVHDFNEANHIPCLFPLTEFPVISHTDWYTLYLSKGFYQEGEAAARYLNGKDELLKGRAVVQIMRDSREGRALSAGFQETWRELGRETPVTVMLKAGEKLTKELILKVSDEERPVSIIMWDNSEALPALEALAAAESGPEMVFVSSSYLGKGIRTLNEQARDFTYITYPFRLPQDKVSNQYFYVSSMRGSGVRADAARIADRTSSVVPVLSQAITGMKKDYYRDYFLDVIGMMMDQESPAYVRLSFGPGQRYVSKGCYIVRLSKGANPELLKMSDWVIH